MRAHEDALPALRTTPLSFVTGSGRLSPASNAVLLSLVSVLLLVPCYWQSDIQAGDLSSHLYNAWLTQQIQNGAVHGPIVVQQRTNVLFDWWLSALLGYGSPWFAEHVAVSAVVLLFFWGAFAFLTVATGRRPWFLLPFLVILSYGLVFRLGFTNFYLSMAFCFWILALLWRIRLSHVVVAVPLLVLAILAHAAPVLWALAVLSYAHLARPLPGRWRFVAFLASLACLFELRQLLMANFQSRWSWRDLVSLSGVVGLTGADQAWLFGAKYLLVAACLLVACYTMFMDRIDRKDVWEDLCVQLLVLHWAAFILIPSAILFPSYQHFLAYIPQRISLCTAIMVCLVVGGRTPDKLVIYTLTGAAALFLTFLYVDERAINHVEDEMTSLVSSIPPGQRVIAPLSDSNAGLDPLPHIIDRVCIGRCFSYGNYEAATAQFRVRAPGPNGVVVATMAEEKAIEQGNYIVQPADVPLYGICACSQPEPHLCLRTFHAGERTCSGSLPVTPLVWSW